MKSTSIRFKVSALMKVSLHRHHPSADLRKQHSASYHKLGVAPNCSNEEGTQCRKQHQHWPQLRIRHQRASPKLLWQYTNILLRRLLHQVEINTLWMLTNVLNGQNSEVGKLAARAKSLILRSIPEPLCFGLVKLRMLKVLTSSLPQHEKIGDPIDFKIASRLRKVPDRKLQGSSHHSRRQNSIKEQITYWQTGCLDDLRPLFKIGGDIQAILDFLDLSTVQLKNDSVQVFDTKLGRSMISSH